MKTSDLSQVVRFAVIAHGYQTYGDHLPYAAHLLAVARHFTDPVYITVALLHDVLEDTSTEPDEIKKEFGPLVLEAVQAVTRSLYEDRYMDYITRLARNPIARLVKIADLEENIYMSYFVLPNPEGPILVRRYEKSLDYLRSLPPLQAGG